MSPQLLDMLKKYGLPVLALVVAFAAGRWTMRSSVEKEASDKYESQLHEETTKLETQWQQKLTDETATLKKQLDDVTTKNTTTDKKTVTKPDGTITVEEHTKVNEKQKVKETVDKDTTTKVTDNSGSTTQQTDKKDQTVKETVTSKETTTPPPSWRVYAAAAVRAPTDERDVSYGLGTMYDLGPINVGGFGLYSPGQKDTTLGVTLGISF